MACTHLSYYESGPCGECAANRYQESGEEVRMATTQAQIGRCPKCDWPIGEFGCGCVPHGPSSPFGIWGALEDTLRDAVVQPDLCPVEVMLLEAVKEMCEYKMAAARAGRARKGAALQAEGDNQW